MEQRNNEQNSVIFSVAEILGKMSNQVSFLIRNKKLMNQLDVDMLMENTRKLYDALCSVRCIMDTDSVPMEIENETTESSNDNVIENIENEEDLEINDNLEENEESVEAESDEDFGEDEDSEEVENDEDFEDEDDSEEDENDEDFEDEDDSIEEISEPTPTITIKTVPAENKEDSGIRAYRKVNNEHITLGDALEKAEDDSLAARLQKKPVKDLTTAIGINDKFLLLNELFNGSMEKYNKSIRTLNNFSTYLGAKTYMGELQIEFQWDCESEAYKKLSDLVERRFI